MKIVVGSKNVTKVEAVSKGAQAYWVHAEIKSVHTDSGISGQAIGLEHTSQGAINRAKAAFAAVPGMDLAIGLEGGIMELAGRTVLFGVVAAFDGTHISAAQTVGVPLPEAWASAVRAGEELGPFMARIFNDFNRTIGTMPYLTKGALCREEAYEQAVKGALAPWVTPDSYQ